MAGRVTRPATTMPRTVWHQLRIVAHTVSYQPKRRIGAELATHALLSHMAGSRWASVVVPHTLPVAVPRMLDGVCVAGYQMAQHSRPDIVLAHASYTVQARDMATAWRARMVVAGHGGPPGWLANKVVAGFPDLVIANSETMRVSLERCGMPVHVCRPLVWPEDHVTDRPTNGRYITLVNGSIDKGGVLVRQLAAANPDLNFLVVGGGYGIEPPNITDPLNLTLLPHGTRMSDVWRETRILVMPSKDESWGMVAVEAMANGIPVIGSTALGLAECLGPNNPGVDIKDFDGWVDRLRAVDADWGEHSMLAVRRSAELHSAPDARAVHKVLMELAGRRTRMGQLKYRNVRTGMVVDCDPGTRLHTRIMAMPLIWVPLDAASAAGESAAQAAAAASAAALPPMTEPPARNAPQAEWARWAVAQGADENAAREAPKRTLVALYGN